MNLWLSQQQASSVCTYTAFLSYNISISIFFSSGLTWTVVERRWTQHIGERHNTTCVCHKMFCVCDANNSFNNMYFVILRCTYKHFRINPFSAFGNVRPFRWTHLILVTLHTFVYGGSLTLAEQQFTGSALAPLAWILCKLFDCNGPTYHSWLWVCPSPATISAKYSPNIYSDCIAIWMQFGHTSHTGLSI